MDKEKNEMREADVSAAERLGRAILDSLGSVEGASEDELVDAIIREWTGRKAESSSKDAVRTEKPAPDPFAGVMKPPVPMRANSAAPNAVDYQDMSKKQFSELKKLLKKAAADGRKIKL